VAALTCGVGQTGANLFNLNWAEFGGGPGVGS
jgi:hypothetical protein